MRLFGLPDLKRDPISAISGGVGLVGNVVGGVLGASGAKKAAQIQTQAAKEAGDRVVAAANEVNPQITQEAQSGANDVSSAADQAQTGMTNATGQANDILNPFTTAGQAAAGTLQAGLAAGGEFNKTPTMADIQIDPGYAFRLQQGQLALERGAAAHGGALGGGAAKDLENYSQGLASTEYQNAFNRYETDLGSRYNRLFGQEGLGASTGEQQGANLTGAARYTGDIGVGSAQYGSGLKYNAAQTTANNTIGAARAYGDFLTQGANAQAAGTVGAANAYGGGIAGGANSVMGALTLRQLLKNPGNNYIPPNVNPSAPGA